MCLYIKKDTTKMVATKSIDVFKILKVEKEWVLNGSEVTVYRAPYRRDMRYTLGNEVTSRLLKVRSTRHASVEVGLHAFTTYEEAAELTMWDDTKKIFHAVIPIGAKYYIGSNRDIVADRLIVTGPAQKRPPPTAGK